MTEVQRRCPQCGDPAKSRHILDGTLRFDDVTDKTNSTPVSKIISHVDAEYLDVQVWRCSICGHLELVAKEGM